MVHEASWEISDLIDTARKKQIYNFYWTVFVILIYLYPMYGISGKNILSFCLVQAFLLIILGLILRSQSLSAANNINKLALKINVFEDYLLLQTAPIKILFWINKPSKEIKFVKREFARNKVSYPIKQIYALDNMVWKLNAGKDEVFIITDFFDLELTGELENFLYWKDAHTTA